MKPTSARLGSIGFGVVVLLGSIATAPASAQGRAPAYDLIIAGGTMVDGTGTPGYRADIAIDNGRVARISRSSLDPTSATRVVDARGKIVAPGFIDLHAHLQPLRKLPEAESFVRQGVTTALGGPDGGLWEAAGSLGSYLDTLQAEGVGLNVAYLVGHNTVRETVMGMADRAPTAAELEQMRQLVARAMSEGAWGMSTGLKYLPGAYAKTDEVIALAQVAADSGGIYTSHLRDEGQDLVAGVLEAFDIGTRTRIPIILTHHKVVGQPNWGASVRTLALLDSARAAGVDAMLDQYPYDATYTDISILMPAWAMAGGPKDFEARLANPALRDSIVKGTLWNLVNDRGGNDLRRVRLAMVPWMHELEGKTLHEWATSRGMEPTLENGVELVIEAVSKGGVTAIYHVLDEKDIERIMRHRFTMIASDGTISQPGEGQPHPRSYGTYPRVLGRYVREKRILPLEQAIKKMTFMPAERLGLKDRGRIVEGVAADIVVFDAATVAERSTFESPHQYPVGIDYVVVNGTLAVDGGKFMHTRAGSVLRHRPPR